DGDATSAAIAAASVIAKVSRDRYMHRAESVYPGWGFEENVGYSTPEHREAIAKNGISDLHRRSFASVAYKQLALDGALPEELEGIAEVFELDQLPAGIEADADGVEADQAVGRDEALLGEPGVVGHEVLDAREHPGAGIAGAPLVVAHPAAGHLGPGGDLVGPAPEVRHSGRAEEAAQPEPAVLRPVVLGRRVEHALVARR